MDKFIILGFLIVVCGMAIWAVMNTHKKAGSPITIAQALKKTSVRAVIGITLVLALIFLIGCTAPQPTLSNQDSDVPLIGAPCQDPANKGTRICGGKS